MSERAAANEPTSAPFTLPTRPPREVYPVPPGMDTRSFQVPPEGMSPEQYAQALDSLKKYLHAQQSHFLGYQVNQRLDYARDLAALLDIHVNNVGDPFGSGNMTVNTKFLERPVLDYYASLWNARWPHDPSDGESYWGYVLSMGSTEGNLYALWNARDYLAGKFLIEDAEAGQSPQRGLRPRRLLYAQGRAPSKSPNAFTPVAFYSEDTHYSFVKDSIVLGLSTFYEMGTARYPDENPLAPGKPWPTEVPSQGGGAGPGSIDIDALVTLVEFFASKGHPIICCFNFGSTFKGAYDDVETAGRALMPIFETYGLHERAIHWDPRDPKKHHLRQGYWIHVDGALGASYMPFIEMAFKRGLIAQHGPAFDFRLPFVSSMVTSGHKWIGAPWPCGIFMTKTKYQMRPPDDPAYIGSPDTTFAGSRNGLSAAILWSHIARTSHEKQMRKALFTEEMAAYAVTRLRDLQQQLGEDLWVERSPLALAVRFKKANPDIVYKYSLSGETMFVNGELRSYNHLFAMESATRDLIDALITDLSRPGAFPGQEGHREAPAEALDSHDVHRLVRYPTHGRGFH